MSKTVYTTLEKLKTISKKGHLNTKKVVKIRQKMSKRPYVLISKKEFGEIRKGILSGNIPIDFSRLKDSSSETILVHKSRSSNMFIFYGLDNINYSPSWQRIKESILIVPTKYLNPTVKSLLVKRHGAIGIRLMLQAI